MVVIFIIGYFAFKSPVFIQERVGKHKRPFKLYKFRSMPVGTRSVGTHLLDKSSMTKYGLILRFIKFDEIPQLFNVFLGDMSLVGPRPCLFNQTEVISERDKLFVFELKPGITGLAQLRKINMQNPKLIAAADFEMISEFGFLIYIKILIRTLLGQGSGDAFK
jgi:lipopolysaccharide/colanic/teichoic acid biosynthesis glycosyltransferase